MEEIRELQVHRFDGTFYEDTKKFLEKQGCEWFPTRGKNGELKALAVSFPSGTQYEQLTDYGTMVLHKIYLSSHFLYWSVRNGTNGISVPYMYL